MREILFRGKRLNDGEWVYGMPINEVKNCYEKNLVIVTSYEVEIDLDFGETLSTEYIDKNTVGEYTGLTDKNGKKIFEGDIVKFANNIMIAEWDNEEAGFVFASSVPLWEGFEGNDLEVIGNIYDNPELLEREQ